MSEWYAARGKGGGKESVVLILGKSENKLLNEEGKEREEVDDDSLKGYPLPV